MNRNKAKGVQGAHECIRPVDISILPSSITKKFGNPIGKVYEMIWTRAIASQCAPAQYNEVCCHLIFLSERLSNIKRKKKKSIFS